MRKTTIIKQCRIDWETSGRQGRREEPAQHTVWYVSRHHSAGRWIARWITVDTILFRAPNGLNRLLRRARTDCAGQARRCAARYTDGIAGVLACSLSR